jgi:hypothetical protein
MDRGALDRRTLRREPIEECAVCGEMTWKRVVLESGTGGGLSIQAVAYRECGCGLAPWAETS